MPRSKIAALLLCVCWSLKGQTPDGAVFNRAPLQPSSFYSLPLGAIQPKGWLRRQLEIQAAGLTGHLGEFWKDVGANSGWLGGTGESWERGPYYLDGLLPLAYQLNDAALMGHAKQFTEWTLTHQQANGQIGPSSNDDWWPRMVMLKVLTQYQEVSGDARVVPLMQKYFGFELRELPNRPLRDWGKYRWQDNAYTVLWLYNRTGDTYLLELAKLLHKQGYDWEAQFANFQFTAKQTAQGLSLGPNLKAKEEAMQTHGVNNGMALKTAPVWWLVTGDANDKRALSRQLAMLDKYHGLPNGMFSGDEHLAGRDPSQGIELCAVVESMFSLEQAFGILGDPSLADRLEKVTFNALPGTISNDFWSHQYDQQPNQIACTRAHRQWSTNGNDSNLFGLEPNFGCCTANLHQGWPKFVSSLWMASPDGGLVTVAYAPNEVHAKPGGADVRIEENTDYPFRDNVSFTIHTSRAATFPLILRIPGWASGASVQVNGRPTAKPGNAFYALKRNWKDGDRVELGLIAKPRVTHWFNDAAVFERGPLVFSLPLDGKWDELKKYTEHSGDWQITSKQAWNYAVELGDCEAKAVDLNARDVPFDTANPGVALEIQARRLPQWSEQENSAGPVPPSPVNSTESLETLRLIPYGAAKLRVTAFPYLRERSSCSGR